MTPNQKIGAYILMMVVPVYVIQPLIFEIPVPIIFVGIWIICMIPLCVGVNEQCINQQL